MSKRFNRYGQQLRSRVSTVLFCCGMFLFSRPAEAQLSFDLGTIRRDTMYTTIEECLGLLQRMEGMSQLVDTVLRDTLPPQLQQPIDNVSRPLVRDAARQCSRKFTVAQLLSPDTLSAAAMRNAFTLLYRAEEMTEVLALADGWLAKVRNDTLRAELRQRLIDQAGSEIPFRFDILRHLSAGYAKTPFWWREVQAYGSLMWRATLLRDTVEINRAVTWLLETPARLGDSLLNSPEWKGEATGVPGIGAIVLTAKEYTQREALIAKLRESTRSYMDFRNALRKDLGLENINSSEVANPILADYWLPNKPATARPTRGKVAVVITQLTNICNPCWWGASMFGRLARKFPEVEFTLVTRIHGEYGRFFGVVSPTEEVRLIDSFHRQVYGFPGMIAIEHNKFWRVDDQYDRRIVEEPGRNLPQYPTTGQNARTLLIDKNGQIVDVISMGLDIEETYTLVLQALVNQKSGP